MGVRYVFRAPFSLANMSDRCSRLRSFLAMLNANN